VPVRKLIVVCWALAQPLVSMAEDEYPRLRLTNGKLTVSVMLPDAERGYYRGIRFDRSGIIESVDYAGHRFYAPLREVHDPAAHDSVVGPAEEFGIYEPLGYSEARAGESFVKIGVGLLQKANDEAYRFDADYRLLRAGDWRIEQSADRVGFTQRLDGDRGWSYRYRKVVRLLPGLPELVIEHRLENSGEKILDTDHYNHNFTLIDGQAYGPDYRVELPFSSGESRDADSLLRMRDKLLEVERPLGESAIWIPLFEGRDPGNYNAATIRNRRTGAAVSFRGDAPLERMVFWAVERAVCVEPFIRLRLAPGEVREWSYHYRFEVDGRS